jgi:hypothetical protein
MVLTMHYLQFLRGTHRNRAPQVVFGVDQVKQSLPSAISSCSIGSTCWFAFGPLPFPHVRRNEWVVATPSVHLRASYLSWSINL